MGTNIPVRVIVAVLKNGHKFFDTPFIESLRVHVTFPGSGWALDCHLKNRLGLESKYRSQDTCSKAAAAVQNDGSLD